MTDNVLQFSSFSEAKRASVSSIEAASEAPSSTIVQFSSASKLAEGARSGVALMSAVNKRLKAEAKAKDRGDVREQQAARGKAWRKARARVNLAEASLQWHDAVCIAQNHGLAEVKDMEILDFGGPKRNTILDAYREALGHQLLTPAPDLASVEWKRKTLRRNFSGVSARRLDKAIADDLAWLEKYPASQRRVRRPRE